MGKPKKQLSEELLLMAYRLREARVKKFKTVKDAAEAIPVQRTLWSHWENAFVRPQDATVRKLADVLGVSVNFFQRKPENWEAEKRKFLADLIGRTRTKRAYYNSLRLAAGNAGDGDDDQEPREEMRAARKKPAKRKPAKVKAAKVKVARAKPAKMKAVKVKAARTARAPQTTDTLDVFFQMTGLIADAQNKVAAGELSRKTYQAHMQMVADMVRISMFAAK